VVWAEEEDTESNVWAVEYSRNDGWGTPERIGPVGLGPSAFPKISFDSDGDGMSIWLHTEASGYNVWAAKYTASGGFGTAQPIGDSGGSASGPPGLAMNAKGDAVATWGQNVVNQIRTIWASVYTKAGGWGIAGPIVDAQRTSTAPVGIDADGNAIAVWSDDNSIHANRYEVGVGWGTAVLIENNSGNANLVDVAVDNAGNGTAVWYQNTGMNISSIFTNRYTAGVGWGSDERIEPTPDTHSSEPKVAVDAMGNVVAVWQKGDLTGRNSVWANRYTTIDGWGLAEQISDWGEIGWGINTPDLAVDPQGSAVAVWSTLTPIRYGALSNRFTPRFGWGTAEFIDDLSAATTGQISQYLAVDVDHEGRAIATWRRGTDTERDLWANRLE
jgi:hypothetical protein